jgi:erythromycin esterase
MGSEQVLPTFDYVASTVGTARPLELAGFDNQFTGSLARDSMHILTERFARTIGSSVPDDPEWPAAEQTRLLRLLAALAQDVAARPATDREALFWTQVLEGVQAHARATWAEPVNQASPEAANARDAQMGRNLVWLANTYYPGRKIIAWAANSHIGRDMGQLRAQDGQQYYQNVWTVHMGGEAYSVLGAQMYAIGFTAGTGSFGRYTVTPTPLQSPLAASLEAYLVQADKTNAFVNFRNAAAGGEWLRDVWTRPFGYSYLRGDWTRILDGMIYTAEMAPSTPASR